MTNQEIQEFTLRISQGNKTDLVVITYDIIKKYLEDAKAAQEHNDRDAIVWNIRKARQFLNELMQALDLSLHLGQELNRLYRFCEQRLILCEVKRNTEAFLPVENVIKELREAFFEVAKQDESGSVVVGGNQVYAGLTYGKGTLNEVCEPTKGFQA